MEHGSSEYHTPEPTSADAALRSADKDGPALGEARSAARGEDRISRPMLLRTAVRRRSRQTRRLDVHCSLLLARPAGQRPLGQCGAGEPLHRPNHHPDRPTDPPPSPSPSGSPTEPPSISAPMTAPPTASAFFQKRGGSSQPVPSLPRRRSSAEYSGGSRDGQCVADHRPSPRSGY